MAISWWGWTQFLQPLQSLCTADEACMLLVTGRLVWPYWRRAWARIPSKRISTTTSRCLSILCRAAVQLTWSVFVCVRASHVVCLVCMLVYAVYVHVVQSSYSVNNEASCPSLPARAYSCLFTHISQLGMMPTSYTTDAKLQCLSPPCYHVTLIIKPMYVATWKCCRGWLHSFRKHACTHLRASAGRGGLVPGTARHPAQVFGEAGQGQALCAGAATITLCHWGIQSLIVSFFGTVTFSIRSWLDWFGCHPRCIHHLDDILKQHAMNAFSPLHSAGRNGPISVSWPCKSSLP
jgi:hypothetical protein